MLCPSSVWVQRLCCASLRKVQLNSGEFPVAYPAARWEIETKWVTCHKQNHCLWFLQLFLLMVLVVLISTSYTRLRMFFKLGLVEGIGTLTHHPSRMTERGPPVRSWTLWCHTLRHSAARSWSLKLSYRLSDQSPRSLRQTYKYATRPRTVVVSTHF